MQIRCNFPDISYLSETQKNNFQFLNPYDGQLFIQSHVRIMKLASVDNLITNTVKGFKRYFNDRSYFE